MRLLVFAALAVPVIGAAADGELSRLTSGLPFRMAPLREPAFPNRTVSIVRHGAVGDGHTSNTAAFAQAIEACAKAGGGRVVVPPGVWLTGPIRLVSNIDLHLEAGALVLFSRDPREYPPSNDAGGGLDTAKPRATSPVTAVNAENIAITGPGIIDGSGDAWRPVKKSKMTAGQWKALQALGGALNPAGDVWSPGPHEPTRPHMVQITSCKRVLLDGPTFQNSPGWNIHPLLSEDVIVRNVTVLNPWYAQNGDGIDIDACRRVAVYNSKFDVGDDAICLKSGAGEAARRRGRATEDVVISNCTVYHGHGGVTMGSEMSGGIRNVWVDRCVFLGTDLGLRFKSTRGRGGVVENLWFNNVYMRGIPTDAIGFTMSYGGEAPDEEPSGAAGTAIPAVDEGTPRFRNIRFRNIVCAGARRAVHLVGLPEMPVENVEFDGLSISSRTGFEAMYAKAVRIVNAKILPSAGSAFRLAESTDVTIDRSSGTEGAKTFLTISGPGTKNVRVSGGAGPVTFEKGASKSALAN